MPTWRELSDTERRVLDSASEDYTQLWELEAPLTLIEEDEEGRILRRDEQAPASRAELVLAVEHLLRLGFIQLVRRTGADERTPVDEPVRASILADSHRWRADGPNDIEVVATDAGREAWTS
jgi:hypothetical protein